MSRASAPDRTGRSPLHGAAFDEDLHGTPPVLWVSVALMCVGAVLLGAGVVALSKDVGWAIALFAAGAAVGAVGAGTGLRNHIMSNVE